VTPITFRALAAARLRASPACQVLPNSSGSLAMFAAIRPRNASVRDRAQKLASERRNEIIVCLDLS
jgi:hypothetical protein